MSIDNTHSDHAAFSRIAERDRAQADVKDLQAGIGDGVEFLDGRARQQHFRRKALSRLCCDDERIGVFALSRLIAKVL